jgi:hypothetical protein
MLLDDKPLLGVEPSDRVPGEQFFRLVVRLID